MGGLVHPSNNDDTQMSYRQKKNELLKLQNLANEIQDSQRLCGMSFQSIEFESTGC